MSGEPNHDAKANRLSKQAAPQYPVGAAPTAGVYAPAAARELVESLRVTPARLQTTVDGLSERDLDTPYRNWTIRQIVHHIADSHVHSYIRFKWALTEDNPVIKAYEEADWVRTSDSQRGDIMPALGLITGLHAKWVQTLESMSVSDFDRTFVHPQTGETISLWSALNYYPWHAKHHTGQIQWLRDHRIISSDLRHD